MEVWSRCKCQDCNEGAVRINGVTRDCVTCDGSGYIERWINVNSLPLSGNSGVPYVFPDRR